ncbi:MAG: DEAD/DEAH box helicase [Mariprofundaceae bacterium]
MHETPKLTQLKIKSWLGAAMTRQGKDYFQRDRVLEFGDLDHGEGIYARVEGSTARTYQVELSFSDDEVLQSSCNCSIGKHCKHVAATLFEMLQDQKDNRGQVETVSAAPAFSMWLGGLDKSDSEGSMSVIYPEHVKQRLLYVLEPEAHSREVCLHFLTARVLKDGSYGKANHYQAENILGHQVPQYILAADNQILRSIASDQSLSSSLISHTLKGEQGLTLLRQILATERCHWLHKDVPPLRLGEACKADWYWQAKAKGEQYLQLKLPDSMQKVHVIPTSPPWYIDVENALCGPIETGQLPNVAELLLNMPALELGCSDESLQDVLKQLPDGIPAPVALKHVHRDIRPTAVVQLLSESFPSPERLTHELRHVVALWFDYDGHRVAAQAQTESVFRAVADGQAIDFKRDLSFEKEAVAILYDAGLYALVDDYKRQKQLIGKHYFSLQDEQYWAEWVLHEVPELKQKSFHVEISKDFAYRMEKAQSWQLDMGHSDSNHNLMGHTTFSVTLDDGEEVDLIDALGRWVAASPGLLQKNAIIELKKKENIALPLADGRMLEAPGEMIGNILHYMLDVFASKKPSEMMLSAPQMLALEESLKASEAPVTISNNVWLQHMKKLADIQRIPECPVPKTLTAELRDYQREGLNWLQFLRQLKLNAILADDMGLGKTVQALAHILTEKEQGRLISPALVIAPTSLMYNWRREAEKFAKGLKVLVLHGSERAQNFDQLHQYDLVLTTYPLLVRDFDVLATQPWHLLVLDEAQYIKNPRSKMAQQVRKLDVAHKLCLTGTPMENHLGELWAQFDFLMPGYLYDQRQFSQVFRKPIEKEGDVARQEALNLRIRPFLLRRSKEQVAAELPPKTEMVRSTDLNDKQREMYESVRLAMQKKVRDAVASMGMEKSQIIVLDALLKMRQVCCDPRLVKGADSDVPSSSKLDMLREMLIEMVEEGRRILLFSQFTGMLKLIEQELQSLSIEYVTLTGKTKDRQTPVERFQNEEVPVFLISLKAGGVGLNLTAADTVIHYDPWWNPAAESQATDRAHRIGQDKSVFVYKLITEGTVEEKILELQDRKRALAEGIHQNSSAHTPLWTAADMDALFAPLS